MTSALENYNTNKIKNRKVIHSLVFSIKLIRVTNFRLFFIKQLTLNSTLLCFKKILIIWKMVFNNCFQK